jgi:Winged helix DNA-binding domain
VGWASVRECPLKALAAMSPGTTNDPRDRIRRSVGGLECLGPVAERVLTLRELNRATLARQLLLHRTRLSPTAVIERLVGMQAQSPQAPYVGIWTRTTGFRRRSLERLLRQSTIVRATATRQTLHLVTRRDYALLRAAFPWETKQAKQLAPSVRALAAGGPVTSAEALAHLESEFGLVGVDARRAWQMARLAAHIVRHHETALWQPRNEQRFVAIEEPEAHVPVEARAEIFRRYLAAFGPSTRRDIGAWSMIRVAEIDAALELLEPLRRFRDEQGRELLDVPRAPLPDAETPAPVRFLPKWDNVLLAWADRTRVLPEAYRKTVIKMNGDVAQTFLVDGFVAGIWRVDDGRVVLEPFAPLSAAARREIEDEAGRLVHARDLDPLAVLDVMRCHASDRTQQPRNVHPVGCASVLSPERPGIDAGPAPPPELADPRMERLWSPAGATSGNQWQSPRRGKRQNKPNLLPSVASGCRGRQMVRRGSTVRVRQRALQKRRKSRVSLQDWLAPAPVCGAYGAAYGASRSRTPLSEALPVRGLLRSDSTAKRARGARARERGLACPGARIRSRGSAGPWLRRLSETSRARTR